MGLISGKHTVVESFAPVGLKGKVIYVYISAAKKMQIMSEFVAELKGRGALVYIYFSDNAILMAKKSNDESLQKLISSRVRQDYDSKSVPEEDIILVMPCTFNTISKIALGISDNPGLSLIQSGISRKKRVIVVPAYNEYWHHPSNTESIEKLKEWGVHVIYPDIKDEKVTMITPLKVVDTLVQGFSKIKFYSHRVSTPSLEKKRAQAIKSHFKEFSHIGTAQENDKTNYLTNGCYSVLIDDEWALITSAGSRLANLSEDDLTLLSINIDSQGAMYWVGKNFPSSESPLHIKLYETTNCQAVVHSHNPTVTYSDKYKVHQTEDYIPYGEYHSLEPVERIVKNGKRFFILKYHGEVAVADTLANARDLILGVEPRGDLSKGKKP